MAKSGENRAYTRETVRLNRTELKGVGKEKVRRAVRVAGSVVRRVVDGMSNTLDHLDNSMDRVDAALDRVNDRLDKLNGAIDRVNDAIDRIL